MVDRHARSYAGKFEKAHLAKVLSGELALERHEMLEFASVACGEGYKLAKQVEDIGLWFKWKAFGDGVEFDIFVYPHLSALQEEIKHEDWEVLEQCGCIV